MLGIIIDRILDASYDEGENNYGFIRRFGTSFFGSFLFHLVLLVVTISHTEYFIGQDTVDYVKVPSGIFLLSILPLCFIISIIFGLIISAGKKGELIRQFLMGFFLPFACYSQVLILSFLYTIVVNF
ncbi:MAG: hypothetical protein OXC02_09780 [Rhodobacteraceae bacterium]|nr:hypothetical protein [Paracoccaceae bacterium]